MKWKSPGFLSVLVCSLSVVTPLLAGQNISPLSVLYTFSTLDSKDKNSDGAYPEAALVEGTEGNFYGVTTAGGTAGYGTVFRLTPTGALTTLHTFTGVGMDGAMPSTGASLIQASDGNFYGTTRNGGGGNGNHPGNVTIFQVTPRGGAYHLAQP